MLKCTAVEADGAFKYCYGVEGHPDLVALVRKPSADIGNTYFGGFENSKYVAWEQKRLDKLKDWGIPTIESSLQTVKLPDGRRVRALVQKRKPHHSRGVDSNSAGAKLSVKACKQLAKLYLKVQREGIYIGDFQFLYDDDGIYVCDPYTVRRAPSDRELGSDILEELCTLHCSDYKVPPLRLQKAHDREWFLS